jgi:GTPase SAR1 family protein
MLVLMGYDQAIKYVPFLLQAIWLWLSIKLYGDQKKNTKHNEPLMMTSPPPPSTKSIRAYIQFERHPDKASDPRIDAVVNHVCTLPDVRSLRYNGYEMIPNFKDMIMIDNDVWFEIIQGGGSSGGGFSFGSSSEKSPTKQEPILYRLSTYDHDITWLHKFVEQAIERYEQEKKNKLGSETYYFDQLTGDGFRSYTRSTLLFSKSKFASNRTLNNVYLRQIDELKQRVEFFIRRRDWYDSKGIPHTLGIVMYGVPGCGKTSTIKGIANETKRHIFNIALSEIKTKEALKELFYNEQVHILQEGKTDVLNIPLKSRLYVIEDIDAMDSVVIKRSKKSSKEEEERKLKLDAEVELLKQVHGEVAAKRLVEGKKDEEKDKLDLATLLNVLDGVRETPGRIIILSTNYPERLDEALLRPGRFDMMLEFEKHSCEVLKQHLEKHYDVELTSGQLERLRIPSLEKKWTPAEVSQILFRRHGNIDEAIRDLVEEDPAKVFKFSQLKNEDTDTEEEKEAVPPPVATNSLIQSTPEEPQSTDLVELILKDMNNAPSDEGAQKKKFNEEDTVEVEKRQKEAMDTHRENVIAVYGVNGLNGNLTLENPSHKSIWTQEMERNEHVKKEFQTMLNSYMFTNTDGFTAMNDTGLSTQGLMKEMGFAASNEGAEPTLEDYFKEPTPL